MVNNAIDLSNSGFNQSKKTSVNPYFGYISLDNSKDTNYWKRYIPTCPITYILLFTFLNLNHEDHEFFGIIAEALSLWMKAQPQKLSFFGRDSWSK